MPPKSAPLTQAAIRRTIKESIDAAIAAERARHANARNDARGSGPVRGQDATPAIHECTFAGFIKCNPIVFHGTEGAVKLRRWFEKTGSVFGINECAEGKKVKEYNIVAYTQRFNELALMCPRMVKPERVKVDAYIRGLTDNIKGEVTSSKHANLNEAMRMAHKLMEQKSITKSKGARELWLLLLLMERFLLDYFLYVNVVLLAMLVHVRSSATSLERSRCPKKVKQEEVGEVCGQAYAIKDPESQGPNVVTSTFLLNNRYASVLFDSGFDRSFVDTRFSSMLNINPVKIRASYEVELADGRVVSMNTVLKDLIQFLGHVIDRNGVHIDPAKIEAIKNWAAPTMLTD
nr:reverse transcriptase domain-containing protein [Tanacetum cinerariifolium]